MSHATWEEIRLPSTDDNALWELFHENSKTGRYDNFLPQEAIRARMDELLESLDFSLYPAITLPTELLPVDQPLGEAIRSRETARSVEPYPLTLDQIATILYHAYGVTRDNADTIFPRPFRTVPSGGALYPLEIFFHSSNGNELEPGLYHYNPTKNVLRFLREGDDTRKISEALVQSNLAMETSLIFFITAMFERSTFKYGARGYRFVLLEAGHVAQNINLVAGALGLGCVNIGGYFDRSIDDLLGLDGVTHSTIYMQGLGRKLDETENTESLH